MKKPSLIASLILLPYIKRARIILRLIRRCRGLTQYEVDDALQVSKGTYSLVELGKRRLCIDEAPILESLFKFPILSLYSPNPDASSLLGLLMDLPVKDRLGISVNIMREYRGLTQPALDKKMGLRQGTTYLIESGKRKLNLSDIIGIADVLEFSISDLIEDYEDIP